MKKPIFVITLCLFILFVGKAATAEVNVENFVSIETERTVGIGTFFSATIEVRSATDLAAFQMDVSFDPAVLEVVQLAQGTFLSDTGKTYWFDPKIDNVRGVIDNFLCGKTDNRGAYGDGILATIVFEAVGIGRSSITLQNVKLSDSRGRVIESTLWNGSVTVAESVPPVVSVPRELSISSATIPAGGSTTVQLSIDDAAGLASGDILVKYDARIIEIDEVRGTDLLSNMSLVVSEDVFGEMRISIAGTQGIPSGSGALVEIDLTASADASGTETVLRFDSAEIYDEAGRAIPIGLLQNGFVTIFGIKGDVNNDGKVRSNDAILAMRMAVGLMIPTEQQKWAADMNGDGVVRSNDAIIILRMAAESVAPGMNVSARVGRNIAITLDEAYGVSGEAIRVPVKVDDARMLAGGDISIVYDPAMLRAVGVSSDPDVLLVSNATEPGVVRIAFACDKKLNSHTIAEVQFDLLANGVSSLEIQDAELYDPDALPLICEFIERKSWAMLPKRSALLQNFPNPFNPETWLPYNLVEAADVTIQVYDVQGRLIRALNLGNQPAGFYLGKDKAAYWDGRNEAGENTASGVYFYTIRAGELTATKKMIIAK